MVKAQKSAGRKVSHCHHRQVGDRVEMEEGQHQAHTRHPAEDMALQGDQTSDQGLLQTFSSAEAPSENLNQNEIHMDIRGKGNSDAHSQAKPLWKPIPPLLTEIRPDTRDQSCQTEEQLEQSSFGSLAHKAGLCVEPGDPPLLQQPLQTSKSGIQQIIECFRSGTSQLKQMLLREVDTIFECKVCRSLFRGLPNLITHKEYYCLSRLPEPDGPSGDEKQSVAMKDLMDIIYPKSDRPDYVFRLEPIQTTTKAVFQYLTTEEELARYPSHTPSARESPVAWESEQVENVDNNQPSLPEVQSSPAPSQAAKKWEAEEEVKEEQPQREDEESTSGVEDVTISCCLCGQDFNSRRSIRRHCRKMHQTKLEELRKFTETRTVPTSLLSMVKGRPRTLSTPTGKSCPVCLKTFATKANVRRHFDEVHRGLRRDTITPSIASRPGQPFSLEVTPPKKSNSASPTRGANSNKSPPVNSKATPTSPNQPKTQPPASPQANPVTSRCTLCKRNYSSQLMLKRHMRIVHKIYSVKSNRSAPTPPPSTPPVTPSSSNTNSGPSNNVRSKDEAAETSEEEEEDSGSSPAPSPSGSTGSAKAVAVAHNALKVKEEEEAPPSPKATLTLSSSSSRGSNTSHPGAPFKTTKLSVGFDFKQLFCKLCKRQFSSRQNLTKHIELHTDGNDIFIKFYRCPLCRYESRRKRDVLRHVTVVHKKSSAYLAKIMPKLESRAVKRLAEAVLSTNTPSKRSGSDKEEVNGRQASTSSSSSSTSPPVTRKQDALAAATPTSSALSSSQSAAPMTRKQQDSSPAFTPSPPITRKQERQQTQQQRPASPPLTRRSEKQTLQRNSSSSALSVNQTPHTRRHDAQSESSSTGASTEVRVTKNFSLHACDQCGRAFAKKLYLESHKRSHRNAATIAASRRKGVSTRSKSLAW